MVAAAPGDSGTWTVAGGVAVAKMAMDYGMHRMLGDRSSTGWILLGPFRDVLAGGLWFSAFFSQNVEWRGRTLRVTRGSRLVPVGEAPGMEPTAEGAR
jgi:ceramide glucosyltransferase